MLEKKIHRDDTAYKKTIDTNLYLMLYSGCGLGINAYV